MVLQTREIERRCTLQERVVAWLWQVARACAVLPAKGPHIEQLALFRPRPDLPRLEAELTELQLHKL